MNKKIICMGILSLFLLAGINTQAAILNQEKEKNVDPVDNPIVQQTDDEVRTYIGLYGILYNIDEGASHETKAFIGIPKDDFNINVGSGKTVVVYINYYLLLHDEFKAGGKVLLRFDDNSDSAEVEFYGITDIKKGTLEIRKYCGPDESFKVIVEVTNYYLGKTRTYETYGETCYYSTDKLSMSAGYAIFPGWNHEGPYFSPGAYANDIYDTFVGDGADVNVTIDYVINCNGWTDHVEMKLIFNDDQKKEVHQDDYECGRASLKTHLDSDEEFSFNINIKLYHYWILVSEKTSSGSGSTKPFVGELSANGNLNMNYQQPGSTITTELKIENKGIPYTKLDWEIKEYPDWGTWDFEPNFGDDLMPKDGKTKVDVTIKLPNKSEKFTGRVIVVNRNNPDDKVEIPVEISRSRNRAMNNIFLRLIDQFPLLQRLINL